MKVLVCGGRDFSDRDLLYKTLYDLADEHKLWAEPDQYGNTLPLGLTIIEGGAKGADSLAVDFAKVHWTGLKGFSADWDKHGKAAGPIRNQQMLDEGKPDLVLAFWDGESKGTFDMIERAGKQGFTVKVIRYNDACN